MPQALLCAPTIVLKGKGRTTIWVLQNFRLEKGKDGRR